MPPKKKSNVEAMKKYRERLKATPEKYEAYKKKERDRYQQRKLAGKIPNIINMPARDQRSLRRRWKLDKRNKRQENKTDHTADNEALNTPPDSPDVNEPQPIPVPVLSAQKIAGRKMVRRENRQAYRTIQKQQKTIRQLDTEVRSLKLKLKKVKRKSLKELDGDQIHVSMESSPATKADNLLRSGDRSKVRKQLTYGFVISAEIRQKMQSSVKRHKEKQIAHRLLTGKLLNKYRLIARARQEMNLTQREVQKPKETVLVSGSLLKYKRKSKKDDTDLVRSFYLQDVNSSPAAGKRETITRKKVKLQKRYLYDSMLNLHQKFRAEHPTVCMSYSTFTRLRPFYVVNPSVNQRNTGACKRHQNCEFKAIRLHSEGILVHQNPYNIIKGIVCSTKNKDCMYQQCKLCRPKWDKLYKENTKEKRSSTKIINYAEWKNENEERTNLHGKSIIVNVVKKVDRKVELAKLCELFEEDLAALMPHQYRIIHQYSAVKEIKDKIGENECVLQMDFSENCCCKASTEIQSMHFGGSRKQISLHTCHVTFQSGVKCYCTASEDIRHSAQSVWAHLSPVLDDLINHHIKIIHFVSDGPTTQYRNKTNFHLLATLPFKRWNFDRVTYNFLEAGHGKGPADGIGAAVKNGADRVVAHGKDVLSCDQLIESVGDEINVTMYAITTADINKIESDINRISIHPVKGTMKIHQLLTSKEAQFTVFHREISCYCTGVQNAEFCSCYSIKKFEVHEKRDSTLLKIESNLSDKQITTFQKRLDEGYDVTLENLSSLNEQARKEYIFWKTWRAAKLAVVDTCSHPVDTVDTDGEPASDESDSDWEPVPKQQEQLEAGLHSIISPQIPVCGSPEVNSFYAVFFTEEDLTRGHSISVGL